MYNADPELCAGPWYSRAWAWGREAFIYVGFLLLFLVWVMSDPFGQDELANQLRRVRITCAKCGKQIEKLERNYDLRTQQHVFSLHCHGQVETFELEYELLESGLPMQFVDYVAFATKPAELPAHG